MVLFILNALILYFMGIFYLYFHNLFCEWIPTILYVQIIALVFMLLGYIHKGQDKKITITYISTAVLTIILGYFNELLGYIGFIVFLCLIQFKPKQIVSYVAIVLELCMSAVFYKVGYIWMFYPLAVYITSLLLKDNWKLVRISLGVNAIILLFLVYLIDLYTPPINAPYYHNPLETPDVILIINLLANFNLLISEEGIWHWKEKLHVAVK